MDGQTSQPPTATFTSLGVVPNPVVTSGVVTSGATTTYPTGSFTNGAGVQYSPLNSGYSLLANAASQAVLKAATSNQCNFIESAFEDGFQFPTLNASYVPLSAPPPVTACADRSPLPRTGGGPPSLPLPWTTAPHQARWAPPTRPPARP